MGGRLFKCGTCLTMWPRGGRFFGGGRFFERGRLFEKYL